MNTQLHRTPRSDDLIYDFGLHQGEDTGFYLKKGFRVVAFEANPELVETCKQRFAKAIELQRLVIIEGAIVDPDGPDSKRSTVSFYRNNKLSIWGTINKDWADRNATLGSDSTVIEVPAIDLEQVVQQYGIPYFMKIDIEGCDLICLRLLERFQIRPTYLSFESDKTSLAKIDSEIALLSRLGYDRFQAVEQSSVASTQTPPFPASEGKYVDHRFEVGCSGLFGAELPGRWYGEKRLRRKYRFIRLGYYLLGDTGLMMRWKFPGAGLFRQIVRAGICIFTLAPVPGWYDTHARHSRD